MFISPLINVNKDNYYFCIYSSINNLLGINCLEIESYDIKLPLYLSFILDNKISWNSFINYKELIRNQNY